jgi:S1-C subfamily serine protease
MSGESAKQINWGAVESEDGPTEVRASDGTVHKGLMLKKVDRFSSLGKAGISAGDEILTVQGEPLVTAEGLAATLAAVGVGGTIKVVIRRGTQQQEVAVQLRPVRRLNLDLAEVDEVLERKISP